jgi:hypothetical protein
MSPTDLIKRLTDELNASVAHREAMKASLADVTQRLSDAMPKVRDSLYAPLWMIARGESGPTPNALWLATSIALIALGTWMML